MIFNFLVTVCRPAKAFIFYSGHPDVCTAIITWCYIHWQLCGKCGLERANNWYEQKPERVVESENSKILWDFTIQCDRKIEARRPDIVFIDKKEREVFIIDVAIPGDDRVKDKELEKVEKCQLLKDEIAKVWRMRKVIVISVKLLLEPLEPSQLT